MALASGVCDPSALIQEYCFGSHPQIGAVLAEAAHERELEIARTVKDHGLLPTTLSGLACHHVRALTLLGRSAAALSAADAYIPLYEQMNERENLSTLRVLRVTALLNLERIDEADPRRMAMHGLGIDQPQPAHAVAARFSASTTPSGRKFSVTKAR